jgi:hypothetical protein
MELLLFLLVPFAVLYIAYRAPILGWIGGGLITVFGIAAIAEDLKRHDDFLDGLGVTMGVVGLIFAGILVGLAFLGRHLRQRALERSGIAMARVIQR